MRRFLNLGILAFFLLGAQAQAHNDHDHSHGHGSCDRKVFDEQAYVISSGRDQDVLPIYLKYLEELMRSGGVLEQLGIKLVPQTFMFAPGNLVGVLSAMNMFPVAHWHDGAQVAQAQKSRSGILELVYPGGKLRHSIFRDDINPEQQISIINHVIGHVWFGMMNKFTQSRTSEAVHDSIEMYKMMEEYRMKFNAEEVDEWYQILLSMQWDQDNFLGVHEPVDFFFNLNKPGGTRSVLSVPRTRNVLQYLVANLPPDTPEWKRHMANQYAKLQSYIPGAIKTKNMNEGTAVMFQKMLLSLAPMTDTFVDHMEVCCLLNGVSTRRPGHVMNNLMNPYFIGSQGMENLRLKFIKKPELSGQTPIQRHRAFLAWLAQNIINTHEDSDFFNDPQVLDNDWVARENLYLDRELEQLPEGRAQPGRPDPRLKNPALRQVVTRDPNDIRHYLVRMKEDSLLSMPTVALMPQRKANNGTIELENIDGWGKVQPLVSASMVAKLWNLTQLHKKPVALESTYVTITPSDPWRRFRGPNQFGPFQPDAEDQDEPETHVFWRIRTVVTPEGKVQVDKVYREGKTGLDSIPNSDLAAVRPLPDRELRPWDELSTKFQQMLNGYLLDLMIGQDVETAIARFPTLKKDLDFAARSSVELGSIINGPGNSFSMSVFDHTPTVPAALIEYQRKVGQRLSIVLKQAVAGKTKVIVSQNGMSVRALPVIPSFQYNQTFDGKEKSKRTRLHQSAMASDPLRWARTAEDLDNVDIDQGSGSEGDIYWGEGRPKKGDGNEDGEPEEGDPQEGEQPGGQERGEGGNDPSFIEIPTDVWGELLAEEIELPNLRQLDAESTRLTSIRGRSKQKKPGVPRYDLISRRAMQIGIADLVGSENLTPEELMGRLQADPLGIYGRGLRKLRNSDWFVKGERFQVSPDINVAVYIQVDLSGSMSAWFPIVKRMSRDLEALLKTKYKTVKIYFVPFDGKAYVLDDIRKLMQMNLAGGTDYSVGFKAILEHMETHHPHNQWDRIPVIFGDLMDHPSPDAKQAFEDMAVRSQYVGVLQTGLYPGGYEPYFAERRQTDEFFGFEKIKQPSEYAPAIFKPLFRNEEK